MTPGTLLHPGLGERWATFSLMEQPDSMGRWHVLWSYSTSQRPTRAGAALAAAKFCVRARSFAASSSTPL